MKHKILGKIKRNKIIAIVAVLIVVIAGIFFFLYRKPAVNKTGDNVINSVTFYCSGNKSIQAIFFADKVELSLSDGRNMLLPQAISASGARYANSDESFVFWNKGNTAFINEGDAATFENCSIDAVNQEENNSWQTFTDKEQNLEFQYPANLTAKYIHTVSWPPIITVKAGQQLDCQETSAASSLPQRVKRRQVDNRVYCVSASSEGAAGSVYTEYSYTTAWNGKIAKLSFTLRYPQCYNYDEPKQTECKNERESFDLDSVIDRIFTSLKELTRI